MSKTKKLKAKEILFSFLLSIVLMIFPIISGAIIEVKKIDVPQSYWIQGTFMVASIIVPLCILFILKLGLNQIGFSKVKKGSIRVVLYFIPIVFAKIGYLFCETKQGADILIALIFFTIAIALSEEIYFRGIILSQLMKRFSIKQAVLISSLLFAAVHAAQAFSGEGFVSIALMIANAFLFGVVASEIVILTESLIPSIIWHALYNFINWITLIKGNQKTILIIVESIIIISYGLYLWLRLPKKSINIESDNNSKIIANQTH